MDREAFNLLSAHLHRCACTLRLRPTRTWPPPAPTRTGAGRPVVAFQRRDCQWRSGIPFRLPAAPRLFAAEPVDGEARQVQRRDPAHHTPPATR